MCCENSLPPKLVFFSILAVSSIVELSAQECKDTKPTSECENADKNWGMCKGGGDFWEKQCQKTCKKCTGGDGGSSPAPAPKPASRRRRSGGPGGGAKCQCAKSTSWDGSFAQFVNGKDFCDQGWGGNNPYVCAGGGSAGAAVPCSSAICTGGQYTITEEEGWKIEAKGGMPYRAFAFVKFCNGKPIGDCWKSEPMSFSFSFKTEDMESMKTFVKLFFWTDNGNMLGFVPPKHAKSGGKYLLATFMKDDYPNEWQDDMVISDGVWYHVTVAFTPSAKTASIMIDGKKFSEGGVPVNMLGDQNGPQLGAYVFGSSPGMTLWINDVCVGKASGVCPSTTSEAPPPTPAPPDKESRRRRRSKTSPPSARRRSVRRRRRSPANRRRQGSVRRRRRKSTNRRRSARRRR